MSVRRNAALALIALVALPTWFARPAHSQEKPEEKKEWDVTGVHGPTKTVSFATDEGTWMNLDVSPDGKEIVFDLLGDIYVLPITGGKARLISGGPAMDVQPRFSPDGSKIAFTSDRAGADNLWIMDRDGSNPKQITKEDFRLVNGPAWTPDGRYLLGRKHFTSTRSLGAGEVWMYHISGGSGLQLTKRKNDQQDQGNEIEVSPDGRYVYFSEDMSGGQFFQYNKDPNGQIYVIRRLDRETGETENLITGAGGSVRPEASPDGRYIAFVRRVRDESVLYLYDIQTGAHIPIYDGLSHDQQETWAIFGVYPGFAWTPDSKNLVIWAKGHLWKVNVESKQAQQIPFEAEVNQTVTEAVRSPIEVSPETFDVKMIRQAATSPDGQHLVFQAVGYLWKKRLPDGKPERLTNDEHFEYEPSFSSDGKTIVYTTWSDENLGAIYRVALNGGTPQKLTERRGYYFTPRFSPDDSRIVYRRGQGNELLGYTHGVDDGLYWMPASGGEPMLIRENGEDPRFSPDGARIYFMTGGGLEKEYKSVRIDGGDERTHFTMKYPATVVPSPDGRWVAFTELHNAYIAPFPHTGTAVELNKDSEAYPVKQVSRDAGTDLHWSADSRKLHWLIGPEYFTRDVSETFAFVDGAPDELPKPDSVGTPIGLTLEMDVPSGKMAFTGARIITMNGDEVIENGTIVVDGNRIVAVGSTESVDIPGDVKVIDAAGKTIMPGIIDVHAHGNHFYDWPVPQQNWAYYVNLAYGVTTMHDPSANTGMVFSQSELVKAGEIVGPRVFSTGTILYGADGDFKALVNSLDDARSHLRRMKDVGAFSVKSYNQPRRNQRQQVLQAARELNMMVVPEGGSTFFHNLSMVIDGHTGVEHNIPVAPLYKDVLTLWGATEVGYTPTLIVNYGGLNGEYYWYERTKVWEKDRLLRFTPRPIIDARARRRQITPENEYYHLEVAKAAKALTDAGVKVNLGAHGQLQGLGAHWELWMLAQGGMTPLEAIRAATLNGAEYLGLDGDLGSLEPGKLADLLVLNANPLEDIRNSEHIRYTMVNGHLYDAETMNEIGNHPSERTPFYWERPGASEAFIYYGPTHGFSRPNCTCDLGHL